MSPAPTHPPDAARDIAAFIGGMLWALLAALLGRARARPREDGYLGVMALVERAALAAEIETPCWEEWVAVPAPWRATQGVRLRARARVDAPRRAVHPGVWGRGPPVRFAMHGGSMTGMA